MSRIGNLPVPIPRGVTVTIGDGVIDVKGPKGELTVTVFPGLTAVIDDGRVIIARTTDERQIRAYHGLCRALLANATAGVSEGWKKELEIVGIGYRAERKDATVLFNLGYSHPIDFVIPEGIDIAVEAKANRITVTGIDRQQVGQVAANIRELRPPDPYKGKGVRYLGERIRTRAGKQGATA